MVTCICVRSLITFWYQLTGICLPNKIIVSGYSCQLTILNFSTPNCYPISYSCRLLLSFYYTVAAQTTPYRYSFQLFLSDTPFYTYQLLLPAAGSRYSLLPLTVSATSYCISYSYKQSFQLLFSARTLYNIFVFRCCYHVTLPHTPISNSHQPFLSVTFISYLHLLYLHAPVRYSYQNSFMTNHYQLQYRKLFRSSRSQRFFKIGVLKNFAILTGKQLC